MLVSGSLEVSNFVIHVRGALNIGATKARTTAALAFRMTNNAVVT